MVGNRPRVAFDVVIIGAGAAGLAAARDCSAAGKRVCLLEARERLGGRIFTLHTPDLPLPIELGAEFIHGEEPTTFAIVEAAALLAYELPDNRWWSRSGRWEVVEDFWEQMDRLRARIPARGDRSFADFLKSQRLPPRIREMARGYVEGYHAAHADRISAVSLRSSDQEQEDPGGNKQFRIGNGYDAVLSWLRHGLDPERTAIRHGEPVTEVEWRKGDVAVRTSRGREIRAKAAILTIPIGVWKAPREQSGAIRFIPDLRAKRRAIEKLEVGHVVKIILRFRERFWDEPDFQKQRTRSKDKDRGTPLNFVLSTDKYMPVWWTTAPVRAPLLTGWAGGHAADALLAEGNDAIADRALDSLSKTFFMKRRELDALLDSTHMHDWQSDPFSRGAYSYAAVGGSGAHDLLSKPIESTLFFAGEATSTDQTGTVAGAIESGRRAAHQLIWSAANSRVESLPNRGIPQMRFRLALLALLAVTAQARVISYAPYTDRVATPAIQHRMNRHFVLFEDSGQTIQTLLPLPSYSFGQVVLYDSKGVEEPRVIYPQDGSFVPVTALAVREDERQIPSILLQLSNASAPTWLFSSDAGSTWIKLQVNPGFSYPTSLPDYGGPYVRSRYSRIRIGTRDFPFVIAMLSAGSTNAALLAIGSDGTIKQLVPANTPLQLLGSDREGRRFLARSVNVTTGLDDVFIVDLDGNQTFVTTLPSNAAEGWITPDGGVYLDQRMNADASLTYYRGGNATVIEKATLNNGTFFAVPTADYSGAWVLERGPGKPTILSLHTPAAGLVKQWEDVSGPEVEALHPAASGTRVLIQVHRPRQSVDQMMFKDPALAVWHVGDPAPRAYDELFLSETTAKGFVHLDVDAIESGEPFVFDSGGAAQFFPLPISPPTNAGGGSDVVQEWGVVRASLAQRLVLPSVGRTQGAFNSNWVTDFTLYNPNDSFVEVTLHWVPNGMSSLIDDPPATLTLQAHEIRAINDFAKSLFGTDSGVGALFITPTVGSSINVTSRTYSTSALGTYGFGMNGIDLFAAASPRFPVTFSGAFQGPNFRTNLTLTDVSGAPAGAILGAAGPSGPTASDVTVSGTPTYGQQQINSVGNLLGLTSLDTGALVVQPTRGAAIASVFVIDNRTNDPTFFPPDIPASVMRVIPAIGHIDGANGSKFRSDLYLYNHSAQVKTVNLQAKLWDVPESPTTIPLTLLPHEARTIRDVLLTAFGKTGIARLRFTIQGSSTDTSVRVTSRTYTIDANGGTYGFLMPPLNSFQSGSPGDTLEILGTTLDKRFRTNLGLVDLAAFVSSRQPRVRVDIVDDKGTTLDSFETSVPSAGGMQIGDLFRGRGLPESSTSVLIRVTVLDGMVGAYAAMLDNGTNDPTYMAANLAAKR